MAAMVMKNRIGLRSFKSKNFVYLVNERPAVGLGPFLFRLAQLLKLRPCLGQSVLVFLPFNARVSRGPVAAGLPNGRRAGGRRHRRLPAATT